MDTGEQPGRRFRRRLTLYAVIIFSVAAVLGGIIILLGSTLRYDEIKIIGIPDSQADELLKVLIQDVGKKSGAAFLGYRHMLLWLGSELHSDDPRLAGAKITRDVFARRLTVILPERRRTLIWCGASCYWLDASGNALEEAPDSAGSLVPTITALGSDNISVGYPVLPLEIFNNLLRVLGIFESAGLTGARLTADVAVKELTAEFAGASLRINLRNSPDFVAEPLRKLIKSPGLSKLSYIDFRTENRVYYR